MGSILPTMNLDLIGLLALTSIDPILQRTALHGNASWLDLLILAPGLHRQHLATELNQGEYPATAAMTTGYIFRVENQATVYFLQNIGRTGCLTTLSVKSANAVSNLPLDPGALVTISIVSLTFASLSLVLAQGSWWDILIFSLFISVRFLNILTIRRRSASGREWKGMREPGVRGDLLILLSQDRWIRIQGLVDDLKAVTSGQWLREPTLLESASISTATMLTYLAAILTVNASQLGKVVLLLLFIISPALLAVSNHFVDSLHMNGCVLRIEGKPKAYARRLKMAEQLVQESGRDDWAIRLGMIVPKQKSGIDEKDLVMQEQVTM